MGYFLPSFVQKRILRHALSRLDLLDTQDIELDNLDIAWGKKTSIELRDIGVLTPKLSALLQLSPPLTLSKARVMLLRITIPADLYNSGIVVEIEGVDIQLHTGGGKDQAGRKKSASGTARTNASRKGVAVDRSRSTQSNNPALEKHDSSPSDTGDSDEADDRAEALPTTFDLAKSFLEAEAPEERAEIHAAVAESHTADQSLSQSTEDVTVRGMGGGISLPGFLADFLKGIRDRLQISITNVGISLDTQVELPNEGLGLQDDGKKWENLTIRISVGKVGVDGITTQNTVQGSVMRRLTMHNIQGMLISDPSLFANLSRFSVPPSPVANQSSPCDTPSRRSQSSLSMSDPVVSSPQSRIIEPRHVVTATSSNIEASYPAFPESSSRCTGSLHETSNVDNDSLSRGFKQPPDMNHSQYQESALTGSFYSQADYGQQSSDAKMSSSVTGGHKLVHQSRTSIPGCQSPNMSQDTREIPPNETPPSYETNESSEAEGAAMENLTESRIFSHEEAQSMYMSAMSQDSRQTDRKPLNMPGNWDSSSSEEDLAAASLIFPGQVQYNREKCDPQPPTTLESAPTAAINANPLDSSYQNSNSKILNESPRAEAAKPIAEAFALSEQPSSSKSEGSSAAGLFTVKQIVTIDSIMIEIPQENDSQNNDLNLSTRSRQTFDDRVPGPFYDRSSRIKSQVTDHSITLEASGDSTSSDNGHSKSSKPSISVRFGDISILADINLTKLTIMVAQKLMHVVKREHPESEYKESSIHQNHTEIAVRKLSWQFLENVRGSTTSESQIQTSAASPSENADILLKTLIRDLKIAVSRHGQSFHSTVKMKTFIFGYDEDTVLAFDSGLKLRESSRDGLGPADHDVILHISGSPEHTNIELTTLPLHVRLDLRRLDETFGWFGGFSGILGLGSSVMSTVTVTQEKAKSAPPSRQARGVRFETIPSPVRQYKATPSQQKITARLGGIVFDLEGNYSAFRLETSAVKLVSRAEGVGLTVDRLNFTGPYVVPRTESPSFRVEFSGLRVEYLSNPKEVDLSRLLALLCPSTDKYEQEDDILVDTLLRQRRQGGVVRINIDHIGSHILNLADLKQLPALGDDLKRLSSVAKYLPEDDRPGLMTLLFVRDMQFKIHSGFPIGIIKISAKTTEAAYISLPSLTALSIGQLAVIRNDVEELLGKVLCTHKELEASVPMVMIRFVGNALDPTVKLKLRSLRAEYHVTTMMEALVASDKATAERLVTDMIASVATVTARPESEPSPSRLSAHHSSGLEDSRSRTPPLGIDLILQDVVVGLNPWDSAARGIVVLSHVRFTCTLPKNDETSANLVVTKAALLAIDDSSNLQEVETSSLPTQASLPQRLSASGYVTLSEVSAAKATLQILKSGLAAERTVEVELRDTLLVVETCADSTQTLQMILHGLQPPVPPSKDLKYRTEVMPVEDMLASFSGNPVVTRQTGSAGGFDAETEFNEMDDESDQDMEFVSTFYGLDSQTEDQAISDSMSEDLDFRTSSQSTLNVGDRPLLYNNPGDALVDLDGSALDFREDHFGNESIIGGTAHRWDTERNTYGLANDMKTRASPFKLRVRGVHVIWNLFDGYDWARTRNTIDHAVAAVEVKVMEQRSRRDKRRSLDAEEDKDSVIGDFLFNSIYIGISANHDPKELSRQINRNIDDFVSESESYATSTSSTLPSGQGRGTRLKGRKLRLMRSQSHKITFELKGVSADFVMFPAGLGEVQSSLDIRIQDLEVFDHLPTSTWKKFATYMQDAGERESGTSMVHLEILNVKPVPELAASEIILKVRQVIRDFILD